MLKLDAECWYDEETLRAKGIDGKALAEARRSGKLRSKKVGRLRYYKGSWISQWLEEPEDTND